MCVSRSPVAVAGGVVLALAASAGAQTMSVAGSTPRATLDPSVRSALTAIVPTIGPWTAFEPTEPNDVCVGPLADRATWAPGGFFVAGTLKPCAKAGPAPDTWLCVLDKSDQIIVSDDNGSGSGNGKGSGLLIGDGDGDGWSDILIDNGDGTYSLRLVVTGFPDGFDGNCNGFFQNAPHGQIGEFRLLIEYLHRDDPSWPLAIGAPDPLGVVIGTDGYSDEFITGAEAFRLNFTAPTDTNLIRISIDNTVGASFVPDDVDQICVDGLTPLEPYCLTVVGGLNTDCRPTDTELCWIDKTCAVIASDDDSGPTPGWSELCVIADINGVICFAVSGGGDADCDGLVDGSPHGVVGDYLVEARHADQVVSPINPGCSDQDRVALERASLGDINGDGIVDTVDLVTLLANWGFDVPG